MSSLLVVVLLLATGLLAHRLLRQLRSELPPPDSRDRHGVPPPSVTVVVPARDEEGSLPALLTSLRGLAGPPDEVGGVEVGGVEVGEVEVVVVDDQSSDATAALARAGGAVVLATTGPPAGWTGKSWACQTGARAARGDQLLFLDADTVLAPDALGRLQALLARGGGLVSVQPYHDVPRAYEQLSAYFNVVSMMASGAFGRPPRRASRARRPMAFGPCLLTSRADYERAGGHAAGRGDILDDVALASAYHRAGLPVRCAVGAATVRMRMYPGGLGQLAEGWTKNLASGAAAAAPWPTAVSVAWLAAHHAVAVGAALSLLVLAGVHAPGPSVGIPVVWLAAYAAASGQLRGILRRLGSFRGWTWWAFPLVLVAFDLLFLRSVGSTLVRGSVRWRGRDVAVGPRHGTAG